MNREIRSMIDGSFSRMMMTAENLALRDELLSNAQARYEDAVAQGKTEEEALCEVAASLEDMHELLEQMSGTQREEAGQEEAQPGEEEPEDVCQSDLGDALGKAFSALGDFSQAIVPEAKKLYGQMDEATGGVLGKLGRAAKKGMRDAQKAASEAIDRLSKESGELVFDFGAKRDETPEREEESVSDFGTVTQPEKTETAEADAELVLEVEQIQPQKPDEQELLEKQAAALTAEAEALCAQAAIKEIIGDEEGAQELRLRAEVLRIEAIRLVQPVGGSAPEEEAHAAEKTQEERMPDYVTADGEIDENAFAQKVDDLVRDAQEIVDRAAEEPDRP